MPYADPKPGSSSWMPAFMRHPAFIAFLVVWILILLYAGWVLHGKDRSGRDRSSQPVSGPVPFGGPAQETESPARDLYSDVGQTAISGKNQLASDLEMPKPSGPYAGFIDPDDASAGASPGGAATSEASVQTVIRGRRMHVIDATGWGVAPPQGFVMDGSLRNTWKPAGKDPAGARIFIKSGPACLPSCMGQPVNDSQVTRGIVASRRSYSYRCPWKVQYAGGSWNYSDFSVIKLAGGTCVTMALLSRDAPTRRQATSAFERMRDSLQPLPQRPAKPMLEENLQDKKIQLLR